MEEKNDNDDAWLGNLFDDVQPLPLVQHPDQQPILAEDVDIAKAIRNTCVVGACFHHETNAGPMFIGTFIREAALIKVRTEPVPRTMQQRRNTRNNPNQDPIVGGGPAPAADASRIGDPGWVEAVVESDEGPASMISPHESRFMYFQEKGFLIFGVSLSSYRCCKSYKM